MKRHHESEILSVQTKKEPDMSGTLRAIIPAAATLVIALASASPLGSQTPAF